MIFGKKYCLLNKNDKDSLALPYSQTISSLIAYFCHRGGSRGISLGSNEAPLLTDLLVLIVTPSLFDTQRLHASLVWLPYGLRLMAHARIDIARPM